MLRHLLMITCLCCLPSTFLMAQQEPKLESISNQAKVKPLLRPEMKQLLEQLKTRQPRLPMPPAVEGQASVNNGRMRAYYLPESWTGGPRPASNNNRPESNSAGNSNPSTPSNRNADPQMTLDNTFKVRLFWIVSRVNNCHYCLGHQELKLSRAGMAEDEIAALDSNWSAFPENEQAAFAFTKKLTLQPHLIGDSDIESLKKYYSDSEIIEIAQTVAGFNSTNRWTDALGIPQDQEFGGDEAKLLTDTSASFQSRESTVVVRSEPDRPAWETREKVLAQLEACRARQPRVKLGDASVLEASIQDQVAQLGTTNYAAALALFPSTATRQIKSLSGIVNEGRNPNQLKALVFWAVARENRGWYLMGHALRWLEAEGISSEQLFAFEKNGFPETRQQLAFDFAKKLTTHSREITDRDIAHLRQHYGDHEVAEIVYLVCYANGFSHLAETVALPLER